MFERERERERERETETETETETDRQTDRQRGSLDPTLDSKQNCIKQTTWLLYTKPTSTVIKGP